MDSKFFDVWQYIKLPPNQRCRLIVQFRLKKSTELRQVEPDKVGGLVQDDVNAFTRFLHEKCDWHVFLFVPYDQQEAA